MATTHGTVSSDDVAAARKLLQDVISDTPVLHSRVLSEAVAGPVFLKAENLNRLRDDRLSGGSRRDLGVLFLELDVPALEGMP